jgi:hypothetical protein
MFYTYISIYILESFNTGLIEIMEFKKYKNMHDSINRITRNLENLNIFIRRKKNMNEKKIDNLYYFILKIINALSIEKVIDIILYEKDNKTYNNLEIKNFKIVPHVEIYQKEFETFQYNGDNYIISETYNSIKSTNSINIETNKFEIGDKTFISRLTKKKMYIDMELLKEINNEYIKENNLNNNDIVKSYENLIKHHSILIKEKDNYAIAESSKKISIYQKALLFLFLIKNKIQYCYAPILFDFRGRVYKTSPFSLTFVKELRICIYFGEYEEDFFNKYKKTNTDNIIDEYIHILKKVENKYDIIDKKNIVIKRSLVWTFISIGENFKSSMGKSITLERLLIKGIETYNEKYTSIDYDKKIKIIGYFKTINMLINDDKILKRIISKDATASVYQNLVKILGAKNDYLKKVNLDSKNTWYDTYEFIIDEWKEKNKEKIKEINFNKIEKYFNRKTLKTTLMTKNYGCGFDKCKEYYFEKIIFNEEDRIKISSLFYSFYRFINKNPITTKKDPNEIINFFNENKYSIIKLKDGSKVDLKYYLIKSKRIDTKIKTKRYTHSIMEKTENINEDQMNRALIANYIHTLDSALARDVAQRIACLIIHDCFMVGCLEVSQLIDIINICFNCDYHENWEIKMEKEIYSIFIVI